MKTRPLVFHPDELLLRFRVQLCICKLVHSLFFSRFTRPLVMVFGGKGLCAATFSEKARRPHPREQCMSGFCRCNDYTYQTVNQVYTIDVLWLG